MKRLIKLAAAALVFTCFAGIPVSEAQAKPSELSIVANHQDSYWCLYKRYACRGTAYHAKRYLVAQGFCAKVTYCHGWYNVYYYHH